jgi:hypothetical protein
MIVIAAAVTLGGCATVARGTTDQVQITSHPAGATARTSFGQVCVTPCTIQVSRKEEFSVVFNKPGYRQVTVPVITKVQVGGAAGFAGNILLGGVAGMAADAVSGATLDHIPNPVHADMVPVGASPHSPKGKPAGVPQS